MSYSNYGESSTRPPAPPPIDYATELERAQKKLRRYRSVFSDLQVLADTQVVRLDGLIGEDGEPINASEIELAWREKWARDIHVILKRVHNDAD